MKTLVDRLGITRWSMFFVAFFLVPAALAARETDDWLCRVVSVQGTVQAQKAGETQWTSVRMDDVFVAGDTIRTLERSRAALLLRNESITRMDENTTVTLVGLEQERTSILDLIKGGGFFFNRAPSNLRVITPFVNAGVEGTEFFLGVDRTRTLLSVFEGRVSASNDAGTMLVQRGQSVVAQAGRAPVISAMVRPKDAVQWTLYFPPISDYRLDRFSGAGGGWERSVRESCELYRKGDLAGAFARIENVPAGVNDPDFFLYRASLLLAVGRVEAAVSDIDHALELDLGSSDAHALQAIIAVTRNDKESGLKLARRAVELDPTSSTALIALSYAQQARFDLKGAHESLQKAVSVQPTDALAWARLAELELSHGRIYEALDAAQQSVRLDPELAHAQTVLGFAYLTQIKIRESKQAFQKAIRLAPAAPLPRLGLGLALIRDGDLKEGRREIEIAAILDPERSLIRSYLGKAYFEEKRDKQAAEQLSSAKELDPLDPTPWYYDAIRKQTVNRPVEGLDDLQKSMELNDNRAVYRSRLMLDQDLAARSVNLARIYDDLGFSQRALTEGYQSLSANTADFSAHRFLSDAYSAQPRSEIGRVSELLQAQMLQPLNINPIQPRLAEGKLLSHEGTGPADPGFSEYNALFNRNRAAFVLGGMAGSHGIIADEVIHSGLYDRFSYSIGQQHFQWDGFRENNDQQTDLFNAFFQASLSPKTSVEGECRFRKTESGDIPILFDQDNFFAFQRRKQETETVRLGAHHSFSPRSDLLVSVMQGSLVDNKSDTLPPQFFPDNFINIKRDGVMGEAQHLFNLEHFHLTTGFGHFTGDELQTFNFLDFPPRIEGDIRHTNLYSYGILNFPKDFTWTLGASADFFENGSISTDQFNPKAGVHWNPFPNTTVRAAVFRTLKRTLLNSSTLEPTQITGFNQFFDDIDGTRAWRYGAGVDQRFSSTLLGGVEYSQRDLEVPFVVSSGERLADWSEMLLRSYLYWVPVDWVALTAEYQFERFKRDTSAGVDNLWKLDTHRLPLGIGFFHPCGFIGRLKATYVNQSGEFPGGIEPRVKGDDQFWVLDGSIGYRLPNRWGIVSLEVKNLLDERFRFQDTDPANPVIFPEFAIFSKITLAF